MYNEYEFPVLEGLVFTNSRSENTELLKQRKALFLLSSNPYLPYGGIDPLIYVRKYNFKSFNFVVLEEIFELLYKFKNYRESVSKISRELLNDLKTLIIKNERDKPPTLSVAAEYICNICNEYSKRTNELVILMTYEPSYYKFPVVRNQPVYITDISILKSVYTSLKDREYNISNIKENIENFKVLSTKIPKFEYIKNYRGKLFHISIVPNISVLIPYIPKYAMTKENVGIKRVCAAPAINDCFKAIGLNPILKTTEKKLRYYVYQLQLTKNMQIVKPTSLVPDQKYTNEHWVLNKVPVKLIGSILASFDNDLGEIVFDITDMPYDPNITAKFVLNNKGTISVITF